MAGASQLINNYMPKIKCKLLIN